MKQFAYIVEDDPHDIRFIEAKDLDDAIYEIAEREGISAEDSHAWYKESCYIAEVPVKSSK